MVWRIEFDPRAENELGTVGHQPAQRILRVLAERVATADDPRGLGTALQGARLGDFRKCRVGDYRIITSIEDRSGTIIVPRVSHRREVYR